MMVGAGVMRAGVMRAGVMRAGVMGLWNNNGGLSVDALRCHRMPDASTQRQSLLQPIDRRPKLT